MHEIGRDLKTRSFDTVEEDWPLNEVVADSVAELVNLNEGEHQGGNEINAGSHRVSTGSSVLVTEVLIIIVVGALVAEMTS